MHSPLSFCSQGCGLTRMTQLCCEAGDVSTSAAQVVDHVLNVQNREAALQPTLLAAQANDPRTWVMC